MTKEKQDKGQMKIQLRVRGGVYGDRKYQYACSRSALVVPFSGCGCPGNPFGDRFINPLKLIMADLPCRFKCHICGLLVTARAMDSGVPDAQKRTPPG